MIGYILAILAIPAFPLVLAGIMIWREERAAERDEYQGVPS